MLWSERVTELICKYNPLLDTYKPKDEVNNSRDYLPAMYAAYDAKEMLNGKTMHGFLPALGQLMFMSQWIKYINEALSLLGCREIDLSLGSWWSSTEERDVTAYALLRNKKATYACGKLNTYLVFPLFRLDREINEGFDIDDMDNDISPVSHRKQAVDKHSRIYKMIDAMIDRFEKSESDMGLDLSKDDMELFNSICLGTADLDEETLQLCQDRNAIAKYLPVYCNYVRFTLQTQSATDSDVATIYGFCENPKTREYMNDVFELADASEAMYVYNLFKDYSIDWLRLIVKDGYFTFKVNIICANGEFIPVQDYVPKMHSKLHPKYVSIEFGKDKIIIAKDWSKFAKCMSYQTAEKRMKDEGTKMLGEMYIKPYIPSKRELDIVSMFEDMLNHIILLIGGKPFDLKSNPNGWWSSTNLEPTKMKFILCNGGTRHISNIKTATKLLPLYYIFKYVI